MKNTKLTISVDSEKYSATKLYMEQKSVSFTSEMESAIDAMYCKYVPQNVRDYIKMSHGTIESDKKTNTNKEHVGTSVKK